MSRRSGRLRRRTGRPVRQRLRHRPGAYEGLRRRLRGVGRLRQCQAAHARGHRTGTSADHPGVSGTGGAGVGRQRAAAPGLLRDRGGADGGDLRRAHRDHEPRRATGGHSALPRQPAGIAERGAHVARAPVRHLRRGGGIDKVVEQIERYQLPAPLFEVPPGSTRVVLFARKPLADMDWPPVIDKHGLEHALCARKLLKIISLRQLTGSWRQLVRTTGEQIPVVDG